MANEASIILSLEEEQLLSDLRKVSSGFDSVSKHVQGVEKNTEKLTKQASTATSVFKGLFTLEMGKKMFAFADATLRSAEFMDGLSKEAKAGAKNYTEMADSIKGIASNMLLWATGIGGATGPMQSLRDLAVETADAWAFAIGLQTKAQKDIEAQNKDRVDKAQLRLLRAELNATEADLQKQEIINNENLYTVALEEAKKTEKALDDLGKKIGWTADQITAFKAGSSVEDVSNTVVMDAFSSRLKNSLSSVGSSSQAKSIQVQSRENEIDELSKLDEEFREFQLKLLAEEIQQREDLLDAQDEAEKDSAERKRQLAYDIDAELKRLHEEDLERINEAKQARIDANIAIMQGAETMFGGLSKLAAASAGKNKELARLSLHLAELEAVANTAAGVTMAYRQGGVAGLLTGIGVAAAGTAQVITIEKQRQKLAEGGIIVGPSSGDTVEVMANGGEMMLTKQDQKTLLNTLRNGGGSGVIVNATFAPQYSRDTDSLTKLRDNREFVAMIKSIQTNPSFSRTNGALI